MGTVVVTGSFDDLRSRQVRFLQEARKFGPLHVLLWSDETVRAKAKLKFPQKERTYLLSAIRYVDQVTLVEGEIDPDALPQVDGLEPETWVVDEQGDNERKRAYCASRGLGYRVLRESDLQGFPVPAHEAYADPTPHKKVVVTGCYDWLHSGHVRFFEETSALGDLYVVVGHDENARLLKGEGHPMFPQDERRYMVQAIRHVKQAVISTGHGWMDAAPEIERIQPDIYTVNEDGDKPEKRQFCEEHGLEYVVLRRTPKEGLPRRDSTALRGF
ncbi:MAG TPA: adenylyltransferase/cytidyltransferase family protein [Anaerolineae bacterium]|nr:adenylyltransferase/cytidyltransferase family protein [Anaerolineae bacterium]